MISLIKEHLGSLLVAIAIVIAAYMYACSNRYEARQVGSRIKVLDKWNGTINPDP